MMLGAKHATIPGFDLMYLSTFTKCMHSTWENILGEEYTDDVRDAWATVFEYISSKIRDGYLIYMEDKENEKREQAATAGKASWYCHIHLADLHLKSKIDHVVPFIIPYQNYYMRFLIFSDMKEWVYLNEIINPILVKRLMYK